MLIRCLRMTLAAGFRYNTVSFADLGCVSEASAQQSDYCSFDAQCYTTLFPSAQRYSTAMKKSFSQRRVPRKVGDGEDDEPLSNGADTGPDTTGKHLRSRIQHPQSLTLYLSPRSRLTRPPTDSVIKRPAKPRKATPLRKAYVADDEDGEDENAKVVAPKRAGLSRIAVQRNANKRAAFQPSDLPSKETEDDDGPSYGASDLQALKESTPSMQVATVEDVSNSTQALDLSSKFGSSLSRYQQPSAIPSATEIAEKKARRARMAKEAEAEEFISIDPDNMDEDEDGNTMTDENGRLILRPKDKYGQMESRLVRDDEDVMEGFDDFTGDAGSRIHMDESTRGDARRRRKEEMAAQIAAAEQVSGDGEDDSDRERNEAFEAAQTRHGNYTTTHEQEQAAAEASRPRTPPKISPLPNLDNVISRLRSQLADMQISRMGKLREMEALQREKIRIGEEEVRIQKALQETAEKFEQLRKEKGIASNAASGLVTKEGTPALLGSMGNGASADDEDEDERPTLGLGMAGRGLDSLGESNAPTPAGGAYDGGMDD